MSQISRQAWPRIALLLVLVAVLVIAALSAIHCTGANHHPRPSPGVSPPGQPPTTSTTQPLAILTIRVTDLRNHKGQLIFGVFRTADGFPTESARSVNWQVEPIDADEVIFTAHLPPGRYSASVLHDENLSGNMDRGAFGVPLEGYGVTNNPKPSLRAATFDEAAFTLPPTGKDLTISVQYFN